MVLLTQQQHKRDADQSAQPSGDAIWGGQLGVLLLLVVQPLHHCGSCDVRVCLDATGQRSGTGGTFSADVTTVKVALLEFDLTLELHVMMLFPLVR